MSAAVVGQARRAYWRVPVYLISEWAVHSQIVTVVLRAFVGPARVVETEFVVVVVLPAEIAVVVFSLVGATIVVRQDSFVVASL